MPIWADVDRDGRMDLITTVSNAKQGAQLRGYCSDGSLLAQSNPIGMGGRWRHQLAIGPFGPAGELELVTDFTPHIAGQVQYFWLSGRQLEPVAAMDGYTSHVIHTRNLDMAVGGNFNGDGRLEIVLPSAVTE